MSPTRPTAQRLPRLAAPVLAAVGCLFFAGPSLAAEGPRNIILMIADGSGFNQSAAAACWLGEAAGPRLCATFAVVGAMATPPAGQVYDPELFWAGGAAVTGHPTDSAAAITAMTTGRKTRNGALCTTADGAALTPLVDLLEQGGRSTGVVTSVPFSHATPAGAVVSNPHRSRYRDIAAAMLTASPIDVIMGAGHPDFDENGDPAARADHRYVGGEELWREVQQGTLGGDADGDGRPDPWTLVTTRDQFRALAAGPVPGRVLGVARVRETLQQQRRGDAQAAPGVVPPLATVPTLPEMSRAALHVLEDRPGGFFLLIEGGAVDWACHDNQLGRMVEEQLDFDAAVAAVVDWIGRHGGWEENLLVVTADHETGYLTGPVPADGQEQACRFAHPLVAQGADRLPLIAWNSGDHTCSLVPFFTQGQGSALLRARLIRTDPVHGPFLDNTDLGEVLVGLASARSYQPR